MAYTIIKEAVLNDLKENLESNKVLYSEYNNKEFLKILQVDSKEQNFLLKVDDPSNRSKEDLTNAIKLYEYYKELPLTLASDEKFWTYLTHTSFWNYMYKRWPIKAAKKDEIEFIKTRYFFSTKNKTFYRNGLSRLWWFVHLTYDPNKKDHYHYTRIILSNQDLANLIIETTSISRNKTILKAVLEIISKIERLENEDTIEKIKDKRIFFRNLARHINLVGGVTIWDKLNEKEAYDVVWYFVEAQIKYAVS